MMSERPPKNFQRTSMGRTVWRTANVSSPTYVLTRFFPLFLHEQIVEGKRFFRYRQLILG